MQKPVGCYPAQGNRTISTVASYHQNMFLSLFSLFVVLIGCKFPIESKHTHGLPSLGENGMKVTILVRSRYLKEATR